MSRFPGNIIKLPNVTPTQSSASGVWSLKDQMVYQRNNLWPFQRDPYFNYTTLLLQGNVPNTTGPQAMNLPLSYNADASTNNFLVTPNGDVGPRPFSPYFGGNYSVYFDGATSTRLTLASSSDFAFGTGAYTIEAWVYLAAYASNGNVIFDTGNASSSLYFTVGSSGALAIGKQGTGYLITSANSVVALNTWVHVAISRSSTSSNDTRLFVNGVFVAVGTDSNNWTVTTTPTIGGINASGYTTTGYISNLSVLKGTAKYTTNFTPTAQALPTGTTNQVLLACASNRFIDTNTATTAKAITVNGDSRITDNSPFVSTDFTTGAGYFKGAASDYLSLADNAAWDIPGQFSIELSVYFNSTSSPQTLLSHLDALPGNGFFFRIASGNLEFGYGDGTGSFSVTAAFTIVTGTWFHLLATRDSGNRIRLFSNGVMLTNTVQSKNMTGSTGPLEIGRQSPIASWYFNGYMSNVRIVNGSVPTGYQTSSTTNGTQIFTPPTEMLTTTSQGTTAGDVKLLTLQTRAPSQNINFIDSSPNEFIVTKNGNTTQGTFSPFSPTGWGNRFDGSSGKLAFPTGSFVFGNSDFTIEAWVYNTGTTTGAFFTNQYTSGASTTSIIGAIGSTNGNFDMYIGGSVYSLTGINPTSNQWVHVAIVRTGGTVSVFQGGNRTHTRSDLSTLSINAGGTSVPPQIGDGVNGFLSNHRVIIGSGPYDATQASITVPTAPLTVTANTKLLTCQSNRFIDQTGKTITVTGTPSVQAFSPFAPANAVSPLVTGGSGYFNGSSNLTVPANNIFDFAAGQAFTFECWFYCTTTGSQTITQEGANTFSLDVTPSSASINYGKSGVANIISVTSSNFTANAWMHLVICRNTSNQSRMWLNGVSVGSSNSDTYAFNNAVNYIGSNANPSSYLNGYISGLRVLKGSALYDPTSSSNIPVPTTPPTAIPNTSLLLNFTNGAAVDATGKNVVESVGTAQLSTRVTKFAGTGSGYFDATAAYQTIPNTAGLIALPGDFTLELWAYRLDATNNTYFCVFGNQAAGNNGFLFWVTGGSANAIRFYSNGAFVMSGANNAVPLNQWTHIALVRSGTATNNMRCYIDGVEDTAARATNTTAFVGVSGNGLAIGTEYSGSFSGTRAAFYYSNYRLTRYARYTSNFNTNLPTGPFPIG